VEKAILEETVVIAKTVNVRDKHQKQLIKMNLMPNSVYIVKSFYEYSTYKQSTGYQ